MKSKYLRALAVLFACVSAASAQKFSITPTTNGLAEIRFTNTWFDGVGTLQGLLGRRWVSLDNFYTTQQIGRVTLPLPPGYSTYRLRSMSVVPGNAFARLALAYGNITTVAGTGPVPAGTNLWLPEYEGAIATNVPLSSPRSAVADEAGNIYVVEPGTHAVLVIRTNGRIYTAIGQLDQRASGTIDLPTGDPIFPATTPPPPPDGFAFPVLKNPTGLYFSKGILYVLDAGNARILKYRNGSVSKLFSEAGAGIPASLTNGGSLWVSSDEQEAFYTDGTILKQWEAANSENGVGGAVILATDFKDIVDVKVNPQGRTIIVDRGDNRLYRVRGNGSYREDVQAGTGLTSGPTVGDARRVALPGPTSLAYLPIGGYLISTEGAHVWYVDVDGDTAPLIFGRAATATKPAAHTGDGRWFRRGGRSPKVGNTLSISVAPNGDLILLEGGYVRKIEFLRVQP